MLSSNSHCLHFSKIYKPDNTYIELYKPDNTYIELLVLPNKLSFREYIIYKNVLLLNEKYIESDNNDFKKFVVKYLNYNKIQINPVLIYVFYKLLQIPCTYYSITEEELLFYYKCVGNKSYFKNLLSRSVNIMIEELIYCHNIINIEKLMSLLLIINSPVLSDILFKLITTSIVFIYPLGDTMKRIEEVYVMSKIYDFDWDNVKSNSILIYNISEQDIEIDTEFIKKLTVQDEYFVCKCVLFLSDHKSIKSNVICKKYIHNDNE